MDEKLIVLIGKDPLVETSGGDSSYLRMWGRAAIEAGYSPQIVCVGGGPREEETSFGRLHRVRSPLFWMRGGENVHFRSHTIPFHRGLVVRKVVELVSAENKACVVHGFGVWPTGAVAAARSLRRRGIPCRSLSTFYTSMAHEYAVKLKVVSSGDYRLSARLKESWEHFCLRAFINRWEQEAYHESDLVLWNYDSVHRVFKQQYGSREIVRKVPYTCVSAFDAGGNPGEEDRADLSEPGTVEAPLLLTMSRHDPRKGLDIFIRALAILKERGVVFRASIASEGYLRSTHEELVDSLGLSDEVAFPGYVPDVTVSLREADIFVLPSLQEGSGSVSMLEAMQEGLAIVVSDVDGLPEDIADGDSGVLVRPGDVEALADGLEKVIEDACLRKRLGARAREVFEEKFSAEAVVAAVRELYEMEDQGAVS